MDLKYVVPKVRETFGNLEFASEKSVEHERGTNTKVVSRTYNLFSDKQRADEIEVTIPATAGDKKQTLKIEDRVKLVNPRVVAIGYRIGEQAFTRYNCYADDVVKL
ncbi:DUF961 family protein [Furfurilactobacillus milii]|uniref:DUF961 domain-containing protein n=1 Tax=Furfurilactobacillus milii TaxID=2888272 RepID=A0A6N9HYY7_9LACO|nr:DUF961 family protein [Furfurilactobacillus milii]MYV16072.1 DUF961 domain-containing protein [Furfurilactobacillus milii]